MSLMPSLCAALERAGGERLVMRAGERPHVLAGERRHDVASAVLSVNAVEALAEQILSPDARQELMTNGSASELLHSPSFPHPLTARAERVGEDFCIELIVSLPADGPAAPIEPATNPGAALHEPEITHVASQEPEIRHVDEPAPIEQSSVAAAPEPTPVSVYVPESRVVPVPEVVLEMPQDYRPEPLPQPDVTVVTRLEEPVRSPRVVTRAVAALDLFGWISHASNLGATMLYLRAGSPAAARIDERIQPISQETVTAAAIEDAVGVFTRGGDSMWEPRGDGEWVREDDEFGYISCRVFADLQGNGLIIHLRPATSLRLLYKHIPRPVRAACEGNGLVVVAASTDGDIEALAAAVADWSGRDRGGYLISLQRRNRSHGDIAGAFVSQRTVAGTDKDFAAAIRRAAQESPDILLVTGLQAEQSLQASVLAAAGGRLVIAGVVAPTTVDALRMLSGSDTHVRRALAASFRAAIGYRSLRRLGGGRTLIQDVVLATSSVCGLIESGDFAGLGRVQNDVTSRTRSVDESLARAVSRRQISLREAASQAIDRSHLVALVRSQARTSSSGRLALGGSRDLGAASNAHAEHDAGLGAAPGMIGGFSRY
jgi:Tfp pilus assembly pilus retraction ATPase PilT